MEKTSKLSRAIGVVALLLAGAGFHISVANAEPVKGVVELFTSQSCSSCPPADKIFGQVIRRGDVIGLAFHVDYWNYLDWKDTFSSAQSTKRQYDYATSFRSSQVYTPQLIVNGKHVVSAGTPDKLYKVMDDASKGASLPVSVLVEVVGDRLVVKAGQGIGEANLVLAIFEENETVNIKRGENSGKAIEYHNAVTDLSTIGMWKGTDMVIELPKREYLAKKGFGCAIFLQRVTPQGTPGEIIGAAIVSAAAS